MDCYIRVKVDEETASFSRAKKYPMVKMGLCDFEQDLNTEGAGSEELRDSAV
jgi:hypothetical protein